LTGFGTAVGTFRSLPGTSKNFFQLVTALENPALNAFVAEIKTSLIFAEIVVRRLEKGFELRHVQDRECDAGDLRLISADEMRPLAQFTVVGAFRPLKSAPNLRRGWRLILTDGAKLEFALNQVYPGAVADWFAVRSGRAEPTHYREFTSRQTGMYRITAMLTDEQAAAMIRAGCHRKFCLKQRLWTVNGCSPDSSEDKSLVPCLEPCALLLEFARKAMRLEQAAASGELIDTPGGDETNSEMREADFENPSNPRRLQLAIEKQRLNP